jgi:Ca2+-transporting ATPase
VLQGLAVFAASFGTYFAVLQNNSSNAAVARTMGLAIIFISNILLVQVNSSNTDFACKSLKRLVKDKVMWAISIGTVFGLILMLYTPVSVFLKLAPLTGVQLLLVIGIAIAAVMWYEIVKLAGYIKRRRRV